MKLFRKLMSRRKFAMFAGITPLTMLFNSKDKTIEMLDKTPFILRKNAGDGQGEVIVPLSYSEKEKEFAKKHGFLSTLHASSKGSSSSDGTYSRFPTKGGDATERKDDKEPLPSPFTPTYSKVSTKGGDSSERHDDNE